MAVAGQVHREFSAQKLNTERVNLARQESRKQIETTSPQGSSDTRKLLMSHRRMVFCDPVAFRYLEDDDSTIVLDRWTTLQGYELYVVEQWICSRTYPTFVICTYTGDPSHSISVNILAVPIDEQKWSPRLRIYFQAVSQFHAREQETPLGTLMVTNLSAFPSALSVISVPDGDPKKHREVFMLNENLKRMGCSGRAAMTLQEPPASTVAKYYHLFHTSEAVPLKASVIELVKLCQTALVLYGKLKPIYIDGLLCDITEQAIGDWWNDIGTEFHNVEPSDGIFGPTTVAALLGLWVGAYNRLKAAGVAVGKDVLDLFAMKRAIGHFQKASKLEKTRRLNRETLDRLHRHTAKTASGEGWGVPRAVKSTVAELSGKGGEMVMGIVGAKEKVGIAEIETLDIERFAQLVPGARLKWLWQGKRPKTAAGDPFGKSSDDELQGKVFGTDDEGNFLWTSSLHNKDDDEDSTTHPSASERAEGKFRRLRDTVPGWRSHGHRSHKHETETTDSEEEDKVTRHTTESERTHDHMLKGPHSHKSRPSIERAFSKKPALNLALAVENASTARSHHTTTRKLQPATRSPESAHVSHREQLAGIGRVASHSPGKQKARKALETLRVEVQADTYQNFATEFDEQPPDSSILRRSKSAQRAEEFDLRSMYLIRAPRRLSFSILEGIFWAGKVENEGPVLPPKSAAPSSFGLQVSAIEAEALELKQMAAQMLQLEQFLLPHAGDALKRVVNFDRGLRQSLADLNNVYYARLDEYSDVQSSSTDLIAREKAMLSEDLRRIEGLSAKLDYELDALASRMQEVEDSTAEFERNVLEIEARLADLVKEKSKPTSGNSWVQKLLIFFNSATSQKEKAS